MRSTNRHRPNGAGALLLAFMVVFWLHLPCLAQAPDQAGCCSQTVVEGAGSCCDDYLAPWHHDQAPLMAVSLAPHRLLPSPPPMLLESAEERRPTLPRPPTLTPSAPRGPPLAAF